MVRTICATSADWPICSALLIRVWSRSYNRWKRWKTVRMHSCRSSRNKLILHSAAETNLQRSFKAKYISWHSIIRSWRMKSKFLGHKVNKSLRHWATLQWCSHHCNKELFNQALLFVHLLHQFSIIKPTPLTQTRTWWVTANCWTSLFTHLWSQMMKML